MIHPEQLELYQLLCEKPVPKDGVVELHLTSAGKRAQYPGYEKVVVPLDKEHWKVIGTGDDFIEVVNKFDITFPECSSTYEGIIDGIEICAIEPDGFTTTIVWGSLFSRLPICQGIIPQFASEQLEVTIRNDDNDLGLWRTLTN